jgi:Tfp pilus assembly protein PilO
MKRLPQAKRNQLILVILGTLALVGAIYFLLIGPQKRENSKMAADILSESAKLQKIKDTIKQSDATAKTASEVSAALSAAEADVATGDLFAWTYNTFRQFKAGYRVDIPTIGQPSESEVDLIPNFPYKQIKFSLVGTGYYQDIGRFVADLENKFPHMQVVNLALEPSNGSGADQEKLSFRVEVVALVKPNA